LEDKLKDRERRYKDLIQELPNLEEGAKKNEKMLEKVRLEIEVKSLKDRELKRLRETQIKYLEEIRDEISQEIQVYQKAQDLDLVLEKTVTAESEEPGRGFRWPIVTFCLILGEGEQRGAENQEHRQRESHESGSHSNHYGSCYISLGIYY